MRGARLPPSPVRARVRPGARQRSAALDRPPLDQREGCGRAALGDAPHDPGRIDRAFLPGGIRPGRCRHWAFARSVLGAGARHRPQTRLRQDTRAARRRLLLSAPVKRKRMQAVESLPQVDGAARSGRFRRMARRSPVTAGRASGHACHSGRPVPGAHHLSEFRMANGGRHHGEAASHRSRRSGEI